MCQRRSLLLSRTLGCPAKAFCGSCRWDPSICGTICDGDGLQAEQVLDLQQQRIAMLFVISESVADDENLVLRRLQLKASRRLQ